MFRAAGIQTFDKSLSISRGEVVGSGNHIIDPLAASTVSGKRLTEAIVMMSPCIHEPSHEDAQFERFRAKLPDAASVQSTHAPGSFDVTVNVDRLIEVQKSVITPAERMQNVVSVFCAKAGQHDLL